ncbi:MAG TPA: hypothetical protein VL357_03175 [Rariglobus sp.]|jgi:hypothetical protein|nr:hypothetical protein [Rariglobus sp.]
MPAKPKNNTMQLRSQLSRVLEAISRIEYPSDIERDFRLGVLKRIPLAADLPVVSDEDQQTRAYDIRDLTSACAIAHPTPEERAARAMIIGKLSASFKLAELRKTTLAAR